MWLFLSVALVFGRRAGVLQKQQSKCSALGEGTEHMRGGRLASLATRLSSKAFCVWGAPPNQMPAVPVLQQGAESLGCATLCVRRHGCKPAK